MLSGNRLPAKIYLSVSHRIHVGFADSSWADEARKWIAWIIGTQKEADYIDQIEQLKDKDKEVYFAVTVLWKILSSWISRLDVY